MDPDTYQKIFRYLSNGSYPQGATKTEKYTIRRRASVYILDEAALYYKKGKRQVVYDKEEAKQIFYEYHVSAANAHCGIVKTRYAVCKRFYWPGITTDIDKWVGECMECRSVITVKLTDSIPIEAGEFTVSQTSGFTIKKETDPTPLQAGEWTVSQTSVSTVKDETDPTSLKTEECIESEMTVFTIKEETEEEIEMNPTPSHASQPFEFVGMYLIGKVAKTSTGNMYICVMVDYHTRWSEAFALPSKTAVNVAGCVMKFFYRFGAPKRIFIDQGQEFVNKLNKKLCKSLGGQHRLCARYYPQTNELFETLNETVQRALSELVSQRPASWDMYLDAMMFVLRTKKHITTEFSPFFLLFGMEARHPSEIP